tara:strand:+ start:126 stop:299 length:174 start_codon:yes stop_codon:yes gene_type:complete
MKSNIDRLIAEKVNIELEVKTRRHFIKQCATGIGGLALGSIFMGMHLIVLGRIHTHY